MRQPSAIRQRDVEALPGPYLLFLGDTTEPGYAKTAYGLRDWAPERCLGEYSCEGATVTTGLRFLTPAPSELSGFHVNRLERVCMLGQCTPGKHTYASVLTDAARLAADLLEEGA